MGRITFCRPGRRAGAAVAAALVSAFLLPPGGAVATDAAGERRGIVEHSPDRRPPLDRTGPPGTETATFALG